MEQLVVRLYLSIGRIQISLETLFPNILLIKTNKKYFFLHFFVFLIIIKTENEHVQQIKRAFLKEKTNGALSYTNYYIENFSKMKGKKERKKWAAMDRFLFFPFH